MPTSSSAKTVQQATAAPAKVKPAKVKSAKVPAAQSRAAQPQVSGGELNLHVEEVLARFTTGPFDGVFTDGACSGNPGPGGWGAVYVRNNEVVDQRYGHETSTTNNRMELTALIAAYEMLPADAQVIVWSDSELCVKTLNEWAAGWERRGWKRKTGPVQNLDLVQRAFELAKRHRQVQLRWIKAHNGSRWNEYADALATAFLRDRL